MEVKEIISWDEYPIIGFSMAMMLALLGVCKDNSYLIVIAVVFILLAGIKENLNVFLQFIKSHLAITGSAVLYLAYYTVFRTDPDSRPFAPAFYLTLVSGYFVSIKCNGELDQIYRKLRIVLLSFVVIDIANIGIVKRTIFFENPINEICIIVTTILLTLFFERDIRNKVISVGLCVVLFIMVAKTQAFDIIHFFNVRHIFPLYFEGGMRAKIIGRGQQQAEILVPNLASNTFTTLLFDYGVIALILYVGLLFYVIYKLIRNQDILVKKQAALILVIIICSLFSPIIYWTNIAFLLAMEIGMFMGTNTHKS